MQHALTGLPSDISLDTNPAFNVLIAYEDFETGKSAKRTYDFLVENIGCDWQFCNQMWKFDVLLLPKLREIAFDDATRADIIMISSRCELPRHVESWIESWVSIASSPLALVALFEPAREDAVRCHATRTYLADVAKRGNMEFFARPDVWPREAVRGCYADGSRFSDKARSVLAEISQKDLRLPRWP